jgi:hypothetical protein
LIDQLQSFIPVIGQIRKVVKSLDWTWAFVCETLCLLVLLIAYYFVLLFLIFV